MVKFSVSAGSSAVKITAEGDYENAPKLTKVTVLGAGKGDDSKEMDVSLDLSGNGEVKW